MHTTVYIAKVVCRSRPNQLSRPIKGTKLPYPIAEGEDKAAPSQIGQHVFSLPLSNNHSSSDSGCKLITRLKLSLSPSDEVTNKYTNTKPSLCKLPLHVHLQLKVTHFSSSGSSGCDQVQIPLNSEKCHSQLTSVQKGVF